jgi:hypothetical protein
LFLEGILKLAKLSGQSNLGALEYTFITIALLEADDPRTLEVIAAVMC